MKVKELLENLKNSDLETEIKVICEYWGNALEIKDVERKEAKVYLIVEFIGT